MKRIVLAGNPNVGKSLIFSRITGVGVISSNYPGTTVAVKTGKFTSNDCEYELVDAPGIYATESFAQSDTTTLNLIEQCDIIINVIDATSLERNLTLTLQLCALQKPMIVCCNFWDDTAHKGISIDTELLSNEIGIPVVVTSALSGEGIKALVSAISCARNGTIPPSGTDQWKRIGEIVGRVQKLSHRHHTLRETIADITIHPIGGLVSAVVVLVSTFLLVRLLGEALISGVCSPVFSQFYSPFLQALSTHVHNDIIKDLLFGHTADPLQSFGVLSTGVYISLVLVFPYFLSFYFLFGFLEDVGYLPRLAVVLDTLFHKLGLHGYSSIPVMLGLGCKVPALLATRTLASRREKILTTSLILMSAPCLPQSAMIISFGMNYGAHVVVVIFTLIFSLSLAVNGIFNKITEGGTGELFVEIPTYRMPSFVQMARKLWLRIVEYIAEVFPLIAAGVVIIHILDSLKIIDLVSRIIGRPVAFLLGLPADITPVMLLGFLRKDVSIALCAPFNLSARQFIIASIFMVLYVPCVASFFTLTKELGISTATKIMGIIFVTAIVFTSCLNFFFLALDWICALF
jgi:ferrous iron transport protein B